MIQIVHLPPVGNVHRVDGVLTAYVDVYLIIYLEDCTVPVWNLHTTFAPGGGGELPVDRAAGTAEGATREIARM